MLNKIYEKLIKIIKENYKFIIIMFIICFIFTFQLPYYIDSPGGLIDVSERLEIENQYDINGSLNLAYISEYTEVNAISKHTASGADGTEKQGNLLR